jgi:hypothetical protein
VRIGTVAARSLRVAAVVVTALAIAACGSGGAQPRSSRPSGTELKWPSAGVAATTEDDRTLDKHVPAADALATASSEYGARSDSRTKNAPRDLELVRVTASSATDLKVGSLAWMVIYHDVPQYPSGPSPASGSVEPLLADFVLVCDAATGHFVFSFQAVPGA